MALSRTSYLLLGLLTLLILSSSLGAQQEVTLVPFDAQWLYLKGKTPQPAQWRAIHFDDGAWVEGRAPIGYGPDMDFSTELPDMRNSYWSVFLRNSFELADTYFIASMTLTVYFDDGFVAYLNGRHVAHESMTSYNNPPYNFPAESHEYTDPPSPAVISLDDYVSELQDAKNVLAVQVHNTSLTSSDLVFRAKLEIEYESNPFMCVTGFDCEDRGDGIVRFKWKKPVSEFLDQVEIREEVDGALEVVQTVSGDSTETQISGVEPGDHLYRIFGIKDGEEGACYGGMCKLSVSAIMEFVRGDVSDDGTINILDPLFLIHYLFQEGAQPSCPDTADYDDNGELDVSDAIGLLNYLFESGEPPVAPGPVECGPDENLDELPVCSYSHCESGP